MLQVVGLTWHLVVRGLFSSAELSRIELPHNILAKAGAMKRFPRPLLGNATLVENNNIVGQSQMLG